MHQKSMLGASVPSSVGSWALAKASASVRACVELPGSL